MAQTLSVDQYLLPALFVGITTLTDATIGALVLLILPAAVVVAVVVAAVAAAAAADCCRAWCRRCGRVLPRPLASRPRCRCYLQTSPSSSSCH